MAKLQKPILHGRDHCHGGADPIPCLPPSLAGDTLDNTILGLDPGGFWKLNESSGSIAADSSGNGLDLTAAGSNPTWAQAAGPPGEQTAKFNSLNRLDRSWATLNTSFTAGLWFKWDADIYAELMGQGGPEGSGTDGWQLGQFNSGTLLAGQPSRAYFRGKSGWAIPALNASTVGTWYLIVGVYDSTGPTARLYINGALQASASASGYVATIASPTIWVAKNAYATPSAGAGVSYFTGSYAFLFPVALTGAQVQDIYDHAGSTGFTASGLVLTSNGFGGSSWEAPTILVTY